MTQFTPPEIWKGHVAFFSNHARSAMISVFRCQTKQRIQRVG